MIAKMCGESVRFYINKLWILLTLLRPINICKPIFFQVASIYMNTIMRYHSSNGTFA